MSESKSAARTRDGRGERVYATMKSPVGLLTLVATEAGLSELWFDKPEATIVRRDIGRASPKHVILAEATRQLREYFSGDRMAFEIPLDFVGTEFQRQAWRGLLEIPFGETRTYAEHASRIGRPRAVRAVGAANGRNPIAIVVPCHRLVGSDGSLTGFGGGLPAKAWLLALERDGRRGSRR
jgi:methylated-DNA-[protein]-cysteine S-methyltransferase